MKYTYFALVIYKINIKLLSCLINKLEAITLLSNARHFKIYGFESVNGYGRDN